MRTCLIRKIVLPLLLIGTAMLGGCIVAPYPYAPRYAYYPHYWWR